MPHLIINHVIKATKSIKSTSGVSYGMLMTLVFKHFEVSLDGEFMDDNVLTWSGCQEYCCSKALFITRDWASLHVFWWKEGSEQGENNEEEESQKGDSYKDDDQNEGIHPSKGVEVEDVLNLVVPKLTQDDLNVETIDDIFAKLRTTNLSLKKWPLLLLFTIVCYKWVLIYFHRDIQYLNKWPFSQSPQVSLFKWYVLSIHKNVRN